MKSRYLFLALTLPGFVAVNVHADTDDWIVSLLQHQLATGGTHETFVAAEGQGLSAAPVPEGGSEFILRAVRQTDSGMEEVIIDRETVGSYMPSGELTITTEDPYSGPIPRTRIDRGFTLAYEVDGIVQESASSDVPLAARQVLLDHEVANYDVGTIQTPLLGAVISVVVEDVFGELLPAVNFDQRMITSNGLQNLSFSASNIAGDNVYQDAGVETFRLYALPDGEIAQLQLDEVKVQVWPMTEAEMTGVEMHETYTTIPEIAVELSNLYPDSTTWVQLYLGEHEPGTEGEMVNESTIVVEDVLPRSTRLVFRDLPQYFTENGLWTLEVLTETPFGIEILDYTTLDVALDVDKDTIKVRGSFQGLADN
ncbi:MAG: hypothetical protein ACSHYB_08815 [Roseibacillus sp.]